MANEAKIVFTGDSNNAVNAVKRLNTELSALQKVSVSAFGAGIGAGAAVATAALVATTRAAINHADALNEMSERTGMAVEDLSKLEYAAKLNGVATESLAKGVTALAVSVADAGTGVGPMAEKYAKLGISVRNADGTMKTSRQVLNELADVFKSMPDGVDKTNLAVDIFGKRLGSEMIPMLNLGAEGMKKLGDEAEALGVVIGSAFAKESAEFNDNLDRMHALSESLGVSFGNVLVPALNKLMVAFLSGKKSGLGFWESLGVTADSLVNLDFVIAETQKKLDKFRALQADAKAGKGTGLYNREAINDELATLEKRMAAYKELQDKATGDGVASAKELAAKREKIERDLQAKLAEIAQLRAIAEGKVSADILSTDDKRVAAQIKNAEKLRDTLTAAWKSALKEAESAGEAAAKLFDAAANTRSSGADRAAAKRRSALSPEEQQAEIQKEFDSAASTASNAAAQARYAEMFGRTENAAKLAKEAERAAEKAAKLADQIDDPELGARAIEQAAEIQAQLQEAQARQKQADQAAYQKQAETTAATIAQLDEQITALQQKAAALKVEADIEQAKGQLAQLQGQLDNLSKGVTVPVTVDTTSLAGISAASGIAPGTGGQFAVGGWTGRGTKYQPKGIVHAEEFVSRMEVVRQPGALRFLTRFNEVGMRALEELGLRGYANGGLVSNIRIPSIAPRASSAAQSNTPINLYLDGQRAQVMASFDVAQQLTGMFRRQALKKGGRR